jgi:hypothetical protein
MVSRQTIKIISYGLEKKYWAPESQLADGLDSHQQLSSLTSWRTLNRKPARRDWSLSDQVMTKPTLQAEYI